MVKDWKVGQGVAQLSWARQGVAMRVRFDLALLRAPKLSRLTLFA
jgi:hypothetical protein